MLNKPGVIAQPPRENQNKEKQPVTKYKMTLRNIATNTDS